MTNKIKETANEILIANGLDFTIEKAPMFAIKNDGTQVASEYFGLINSKSGEVINTVKEGYTVSQNREVVELVLSGMEGFGNQLNVSKAGSLNGGRKVFMQLGIEGNSLVGDDIIKRYVTIIDSNDGSTSLSVGIGDLTMSCQNQFWKFYKKGEAKFRHTATLEQKILSIPTLIETALSESLKQIKVYNQLASTPITKRLADEMVKYILGYDRVITSVEKLAEKSTRSINTMDKMYDHITKEINQKGLNLWGLHSGITSYTTHEISAPKRDNGRLESGLIGNAYLMNQKSLNFVMSKANMEELVLS